MTVGAEELSEGSKLVTGIFEVAKSVLKNIPVLLL